MINTDLASPMALVIPGKSHPEVIVQAISARNRTRAEEFAKKHGIPDVRDSYQGTLTLNFDLVRILIMASLQKSLTTQTSTPSSSHSLTVYISNGPSALFELENMSWSKSHPSQIQKKPRSSSTCQNYPSQTLQSY